LVVTIFVVVLFNSNYIKGLQWSLLFLIVLPQYIGIHFGGAFPVLTIHRIIVIISIIYWLSQKEVNKSKVPLMGIFVLIVLANTVSLLQAPFFTDCLKKYLAFIIEGIVFFSILVTSLKNEADIKKTLRYIYMAIFITAVMGFFERYTGIKPILLFPSFESLAVGRGLLSTFSHPIMFGVAMAIGLIISVHYLSLMSKDISKTILWIGVLLMGSCLYFTVKRGAWLAAMIGLVSMFFLSSGRMKGKIALIILFPLMVVLINPGVLGTITDTYETTMDDSSLRGASFTYRFELWNVSYSEIKKSTERMAFGYGFNYHANVDFYREFELIEGRRSHFTSWDSEFATLLLENGIVGLFLHVVLYITMLWYLFKKIFVFRKQEPYFMPCIFSSVLAIVFMMTNVKMFSPQIMFIFYSMVAIGLNYEPKLSEANDKTA
jgi:hypothetical protein